MTKQDVRRPTRVLACTYQFEDHAVFCWRHSGSNICCVDVVQVDDEQGAAGLRSTIQRYRPQECRVEGGFDALFVVACAVQSTCHTTTVFDCLRG